MQHSDVFYKIINLYAIKLTNYITIMDATIHARHIDISDYDRRKIPDTTYQYDFSDSILKAQSFLIPIIYACTQPGVQQPAGRDIQCSYQDDIVKLLNHAKQEHIIKNEPLRIKATFPGLYVADTAKFKTDVLAKIKLPAYLAPTRTKDGKGIGINYNDIEPFDPDAKTIGCSDPQDLFHSLTNCDFPHLIHEQIEYVRGWRLDPYPVFQDGKIYDSNILYRAIRKLGYMYFTNYGELEQAVGTNGMELSRQIANRMFDRVKK